MRSILRNIIIAGLGLVFSQYLNAQVTYTTSTDGISCTAGKGRIHIQVTSGKSPYVFELFNNLPYIPGNLVGTISQPGNTATFEYLDAGTYYVRIFDDDGFGASGPVTLDAGTVLATELTANAITIVKGLDCPTSTDAQLEANPDVTSGTGGYTYEWSANAGGQTTKIATGLGVGIYRVTINDSYGCADSVSTNEASIAFLPGLTDSIPTAISAGSILANQSICTGTSPALITSTAAASGGKGFTYQWQESNDGFAWSDIAGATSETYNDPAILVADKYYRRGAVSTFGCGTVYTNTHTVTVNPLPNVTLAAFADVCQNDAAFALSGGLPAGGTYSGTGVSGGNFDPATAGAGTHTITYTYTDGNGCTNFATNTITVNTLPVVTLGAFADVCINTPAFALGGGLPAGGTYSGPGVSGGNFNAATAGVGTHTITYTYTDGNGCTNFATNTITVNDLPNVSLAAFADVCIDAPAFVLTGGLPIGGTYSGTGVSGGNFDPATAGAGTHTITYTYTDGNGCTKAAVSTITVNPLPIVALAAFADVCSNTPAFALSGGSPSGGTYTGTGVSGGNFDPAVAGVGTHTITYTYIDANGCSDFATNTITVNLAPNATLGAFADVCIDAPAFALAGGLPLGGTYSGTGVSGGNFDPAAAGAGTHTITYTYTDGNGCTDFATSTITVNPLPVVTLGAFADVCVDAPAFALSGGSPLGGTYSGTGVSGGNFDPATAGVGTHTITYSYTDANGCTNTANSTINVNALPNVTLAAFADVCSNTPAFALSGGLPVGGTYTGTGVSGGNFDPAAAGAGTHTITYTYTDANGCTNFATNTITVNLAPTATLGAFADVCENTPDFALAGGLPAGGTYTGTGVSGGNFDPAAAGTGTHTITYTYTDANGCTDFATSTITVNPLPNVTLGAFADVCIDAPAFVLTGGLPAGGSYSGTGVSGGNFNPATAGAGTHTITYTYTDANGCSDFATSTITVNPLPNVTLAAFADVCSNTPTFSLTGGLPAGGTYSGTGVSGGNFNPATAGAGTHTITYTYTDANGCSNFATNTITVNLAPTVTLGAFADVCQNTPAFVLTGGLPAGGTYSGTGVSGGNFDPATAGVGTHTITYTYTDANGCSDFATSNITVNPLPNVTLGAFADVCIDVPTFSLTGGLPVGGTYSGTGVSGGNFNPAAAGAGTHTITYTYTDANGCSNFATSSITVNPLPIVTLDPFADVCENDPPFVLSGGLPLGGTYSGTGVSGGNFDPATAGAGTHIITYTYTDGSGCTNAINRPITVNAAPVVSLGAFADVCIDVPAFALSGGLPLGGTYSGTGVSGGNFDPAAAGAGTHTITYTYTDGNGCTDFATSTITVNPLPVVTLGAFADVCIDAPAFALSGGTPLGGTYSGPGVSGGNFDPATAGAGTHTITYTYTDANGCSNSATSTITVNPLPIVTLGAFADVCIDAPAFALSGGTPAGGIYTGTGISGGNFDPAAAGAGTHTITYTYADANGCSNFATNTITVNPLPIVTLGAFADVCINVPAFALSGGAPLGGTYTGPGVTAGNFDPAAAGAGTHTITYTYIDANGCSDIATSTITVNPLPIVTLGAFADVCIDVPAFALSGGTPLGGTYSGTGVTGGNFDPAVAGAGTHTITYTYTDANGCANFATNTITVNPLPTVTLDPYADVCLNTPAFALSGGLPAGGSYSGAGVAGGNFDPVSAGVGTHTITYTYSDANGCTNFATNTITVNPLPVVTLGAFADVCLNTPAFALSGGTPLGGAYSGTGVTGGNFDPAVAGAGTHAITYTFTDANGCTNFATSTITVNPLPTVTLGAFADVCIDAPAFALSGGSPSGGTYSGTGVAAGNFDPAAAGAGTHTITYTYTDANGCTDLATSTITVNPLPTVTLDPFADVCENIPAFALSGGLPAGGTYSGTGVAAGNFDPSTAGVGTHTITYTYTDANGCSNFATNTITVNPVPVPTIDPKPISACQNQDLGINALAAGGTPPYAIYDWTGSAAAFLNDPTSATPILNSGTPGNYQLILSITDDLGCLNSDTTTVEIIPEPVSYAGPDTTLCFGGDYTVAGADSTNASSIQWYTNGGDGVFDDNSLINPTYTPGPNDIINGSVELILRVFGNGSCSSARDTAIVTLADPVQPFIGAPAPFFIGSNTEINVCISTNNHQFIADMGFRLITPNQNEFELKKALLEIDPFVPPCFPPPPGNVDSICFTTELALADTLDACGEIIPINGTFAATGDWSTLYGLNPGEAGWGIRIIDTDDFGTGGTDGEIIMAKITFTDTATATNQLTTVRYESGAITEPIIDNNSTTVTIQRELQVSCPDVCDAQAIVNTVGGTPPYLNYNWSPAPAGGNAADSVILCAGTYDLTVTDAIGCTGTTSVTVLSPPVISIDTTYYTNTLNCFADTTGFIVVKASGGTGSLTYTLNPGNIPSASADSGYFPNLAIGTYTITVEDGSSCTRDTVFTITQPPVLVLDTAFVADSVFCSGDNNGQIIATASGGTQPYRFILAPLSGPSSDTVSVDSARFQNLAPGSYLIRLTDANGCDTINSDTLILGVPAPLQIDTVFVSDSIVCNGGVGELTIIASGGRPPYDISGIPTPVIGAGDTTIVGNLLSNNYDIVVTDSKGCTANYPTVNLTEPAPVIIDSIVITPIADCYYNPVGAFTVYAQGGTGSLEYSIDSVTYQASNVFGSLTGGDYTIYVRDTRACAVFKDTAMISPPLLNASVSVTPVDVPGESTGEVIIHGSGGTPFTPGTPYEYSFDGGAFNSDSVYSNLPVGSYEVIVRDANGCTDTTTAFIQVNELNANVTVVDLNCYGDNSGSYTITCTDGVQPYYVYQRDTNLVVGDTVIRDWVQFAPITIPISNQRAGTYYIQLGDSGGRIYDTIITISEPPLIQDSIFKVRPICQEFRVDEQPNNTGRIEVYSKGGTGNFSYSWSDNASSQDSVRTALDPDTYYVTITDDSGCSIQDTIDLLGQEIIAPNLRYWTGTIWTETNQIDCYGAENLLGVIHSDGDQYEWTLNGELSSVTDSEIEHTLTDSTRFVVTVSTNNCFARDALIVDMHDTIGMVITPFDNLQHMVMDTVYLAEGEKAILSAPLGYASYEWRTPPNIATADPTNLESTTITILEEPLNPYDLVITAIGTTTSGCEEIDQVYILIQKPVETYTGFTPNGDGFNDYWEIGNAIQYPDIHVSIYNRWGQLVYEQDGYGQDTDSMWDGTHMKNGNELPIGTYYYVIKPNDGKSGEITGTVTIVR